jgi:hypothetical protein
MRWGFVLVLRSPAWTSRRCTPAWVQETGTSQTGSPSHFTGVPTCAAPVRCRIFPLIGGTNSHCRLVAHAAIGGSDRDQIARGTWLYVKPGWIDETSPTLIACRADEQQEVAICCRKGGTLPGPQRNLYDVTQAQCGTRHSQLDMMLPGIQPAARSKVGSTPQVGGVFRVRWFGWHRRRFARQPSQRASATQCADLLLWASRWRP